MVYVTRFNLHLEIYRTLWTKLWSKVTLTHKKSGGTSKIPWEVYCSSRAIWKKKVLALTGCTYVWVNKMQMNSESWGMNHLHSAVLIVLASLLISCMYLNKDKTSSWKLKDIKSNEQRSWCTDSLWRANFSTALVY
jgi:hypothetical protein